MKYFLVRPEVPGHLASALRGDFSASPPRIDHVHVEFDGWLGGELVEFENVFLITDEVKRKLEQIPLTGYSIADVAVEISFNPQLGRLGINFELPHFYLLQVTGAASRDDIGSSGPYSLVVSERAMAILETCDLSDAEVDEYPLAPALDPFRMRYFAVHLPLQMEVGMNVQVSMLSYAPIPGVDIQWIGSNMYFLSSSLLSSLADRGATGFTIEELTEFVNAEISARPQFQFVRITGSPLKDDIGKADGMPLVVSERISDLVRENCNLLGARIDKLPAELTWSG